MTIDDSKSQVKLDSFLLFRGTGAIYCDAAVRRSGMNGEGVHSGAVLVTNTHFFSNVTWTEPDEPASVYLPNHSTVSLSLSLSLSLSRFLSHLKFP